MKSTKTVPGNMNDICRLCLSSEEGILPIFGEDEVGGQTSIPLSFRILACVSVEVSLTDGLPTLICRQCLNQVNTWHEFKQVCDSSQATLKEWQCGPGVQTGDKVTSRPENEITIKQEPVDLGGEEDDDMVYITEETNSREYTAVDIKHEEIEVCDDDEEDNHLHMDNDTSTDLHGVVDDPLGFSIIENSRSSLLGRAVKVEPTDSDVEVIQRVQSPNSPSVTIIALTSDGTVCSNSELNRNIELHRDDSVSISPVVNSSTNIHNQAIVGSSIGADNTLGIDPHLQIKTERVEGETVPGPRIQVKKRKYFRKRLTLKKKKKGAKSKAAVVRPLNNIVVVPKFVKPFICSVCDKEFAYSYLLKRHSVTHTRGKNICTICNKGFSNRSGLERHFQLHTAAKPYATCKQCFQEFPSKYLYYAHKNSEAGYSCPGRLDHVPIPSSARVEEEIAEDSVPDPVQDPSEDPSEDPVDNYLDCYVCKRSFPTKISLQLHMEEHGYSCHKCNKTFKGGTSLSNHLRSHDSRGFKRHSCRVCLKSFTNIASLVTHRKIHFTARRRFTAKNVTPQKVSPNDDDDNQKFDPAMLFEQNIDDKSFSPDRTQRLTCNICNRVTNSQSALMRHMVTHTKQKMFSCKVCKVSMGYASSLHKHMRLTHGMVVDYNTIRTEANQNSKISKPKPLPLPVVEEKKNFALPLRPVKKEIMGDATLPTRSLKCNYCHKTFNNNHKRATHMKIVHLGLRTFKCTICSQVFAYKSFLIRHSRVHLSDVLYTCSVCLESFGDQKTLNNHKGVHTRFKYYSCNFCSKSFNGLKSWEQHQKMHKKGIIYSCKLCGKKFVSKADLHEHKKMHIKLKIYSCTVCKNSYNSSSALSKHKRKHMNAGNAGMMGNASSFYNVNPFADTSDLNLTQEVHLACGICKKTFSDTTALNKHRLLHRRRPVKQQETPQTNVKTPFRVGNSTNMIDEDAFCVLCNRQFNDHRSLVRHKGWHTRRTEAATAAGARFNPLYVEPPLPAVVSAKRYNCKDCPKSFMNSGSLSKHRRIHHRLPPKEPPQVENQKLLPQVLQEQVTPKKIVNSKHLFCKICHKQFSTVKALITHTGWHSRERGKWQPLKKSKVLPSKSAKSQSLKKQQSSWQTPKMKLEPGTDVTYGKQRANWHPVSKLKSLPSDPITNTIHSKQQGMWQSVVSKNKSFLLESATDTMNSFSEAELDDIYSCNVCKKSFSSSSALSKHKRLHTRKLLSSVKSKETLEEEPPALPDDIFDDEYHEFSCDFCHKSFKCEQYLLMHERLHRGERPFACTMCPRAFSRSSTLWKHKKVHMAFKAFSCPLCQKKFTLKFQLTRHMQQHEAERAIEPPPPPPPPPPVRLSGKKSFPCSICAKTYSRKDNLLVHVRTQHQ